MGLKNENKKLKEIALLLADSESGNLLTERLDTKKLDFSIDSLRRVDRYLESIRKTKKNLNDEEIGRVILRVGAYLGEVIRRSNTKNFIWLSYEEGSKLGKFLPELEKSISTVFVIYDLKADRFLFVLNKVTKFLEDGKKESLWCFTKAYLEDFKLIKKMKEKIQTE